MARLHPFGKVAILSDNRNLLIGTTELLGSVGGAEVVTPNQHVLAAFDRLRLVWRWIVLTLLILAPQNIFKRGDKRQVDSRNVGLCNPASRCEQNNIESLQVLNLWLGLILNFNIQLIKLGTEPIRIPTHFVLPRHSAAVQHCTAKLTGSLEYSNFVSAQSGETGSLHTRRPATYYRNLAGFFSGLQMNESLITNSRINRASHVTPNHQRFLPAANKAGNAPSYLLLFTSPGFVGPIWVCNQLSAKADHIGFTLSQNLLTVIRIPQRMAGDNGDFHVLFDLLGRVRIPSFGIIHRIHYCSGRLEYPCTNIYVGQTHFFHKLGHPNGFIERPSSFYPFVARIANAERIALSAFHLNPISNLHRKTHPAHETAAETVGSLVHKRAHKLRDEVAMGGMELYGIKTRLLNPPGSFAELLNQVVYFLDCHSTYRFALGDALGIYDLMTGRARDIQHMVTG